MFFANSRKRFFKSSWLDCEQYGKNQYKKKNKINIVRCLKCTINFILFKCYRSNDNSNYFYLVAKMFMIKNSVVKIQNLVLNYDLLNRTLILPLLPSYGNFTDYLFLLRKLKISHLLQNRGGSGKARIKNIEPYSVKRVVLFCM